MPPPVEGPSTHFFTPDSSELAAADIREAGGVEVFFVGRRNEAGLVAEVEAHAFGTPDAVPALMNLARPGDVIIHNHPSGALLPSEADLSVASSMGNMGVGCYIINNDCSQCRVIVKPQDAKKKTLLKEDEVTARLSPRGQLAQVIEEFEDRPQQRSMAASVVRAFNNDGLSVVEAGTGTGKSLAYLVPSVYFALRNNERVVISTNTINLQEQLLNKDIPAVARAVGEQFEVEIVKGRSNYVCKRKAEFAGIEAQSLLEDDFVSELKEVLEWASTSATGDRNELPIPPRYEVWERVQSEADNCLRVRCPFYESCFFYNSRRRAARAKLLIVNHSLLMSDLAVRRASGNYSSAAVLPPYSRVILDEAHHLEEVATKNLASQVTRPGLRQLFGRLHRRDSSGGRGVLATLSEEIDKLVQAGKLPMEDPRVHRLLFELAPRVPDVRDSVDFLLNDFGARFLQVIKVTHIKPGEEQKHRITPVITESALWREECEPLLNDMAAELAQFADAHRKLHEQFLDVEEEVLNALLNALMEWQALIGRMDAVRRTILDFLTGSRTICRWVEVHQPSVHARSRETIVRLCLAPIDVRQLLRESLHDRMKSEVLTSATLSVDRTFDFFQERTGLPIISKEDQRPEVDEDGMPIHELNPVEARAIETHILPTPFDYQKQVFFAVPTDLPDPREATFDEKLVDLINRSVAITGGRAFILFTSYGQLNRIHKECEPMIRRLGIEVLRQGAENRDVLLQKFRDDETSVLFATSSFWEGVDVKGRALELLIIAKLPFSVPTEPVQEAQFEAMQSQGRDPFENLVVPRAVIRFKQGFGRLIRSRTDRGAVIIADKRVVQMRYGRRFLYSLPDVDVRRGPTIDLMGGMRQFFEERNCKS